MILHQKISRQETPNSAGGGRIMYDNVDVVDDMMLMLMMMMMMKMRMRTMMWRMMMPRTVMLRMMRGTGG